jgi:pilus assembly protein TadC
MDMMSPGLAAISLTLGFSALRWMERAATLRRLRSVMGQPDRAARPGFSHGLHWLGERLPGAGDSGLRRTLAQAGYVQPGAVPIFVAGRLLCTAALLVFFLLRPGATASTTSILLALFLTFFLSRLFVIALKLKAEARQQEIRRELPPVVDVLLMVLGSGVSIDQSLRYVASLLENSAPQVCRVFQLYVADVDHGMSYEAAFERMGQRLGIDEGYDLAGLIRQALLQGGEITAALERFSAEIAEKRVSQAREQVGRKAVVLTIVMLAFFMPVLLITLGGPAVSNIQDTLHTVKGQLHKRETRR